MIAFLTYQFLTLQGAHVFGIAFLGSAPQAHDQNVINANLAGARSNTGQAANLQPGYTAVSYGESPFKIL